MLGREESTELLTFGAGRRKSSKTGTTGVQKVDSAGSEAILLTALRKQIWVKGAELCVADKNSMKSTATNPSCARTVRKGSERPTN